MDVIPSREYYSGLFDRISAGRFEVKLATPLEEERFAVTQEIIAEHFNRLSQLQIERIRPEMIINLDETGVGQSKSGRTQSVKVIVPAGMAENPTCLEKKISHYVTSLSAVTAGGKLLRPAFITKRHTDHPDGASLSFSNPEEGPLRYSTPKAFISRDVFTDYLRQIVIPYIQQMREQSGNREEPDLIIFDGHKSHLTPILHAACADCNTILYCLPPHSSHLLQALDKGVFRRFKSQFALLDVDSRYSKILYLGYWNVCGWHTKQRTSHI